MRTTTPKNRRQGARPSIKPAAKPEPITTGLPSSIAPVRMKDALLGLHSRVSNLSGSVKQFETTINNVYQAMDAWENMRKSLRNGKKSGPNFDSVLTNLSKVDLNQIVGILQSPLVKGLVTNISKADSSKQLPGS